MAIRSGQRVVRCRLCGARQGLARVAPGQRAACHRCESPLCRGGYRSLDVPLALTLAALVCWVFANLVPFVSLEYGGISQTGFVLSGAIALWAAQEHFVAALVAFSGVFAPGLYLALACYALAVLRHSGSLQACRFALRAMSFLGLWSMAGVYLIGVLVAAVKLADLASLSAGPGLYAWIALVLLWASASGSLDVDSLEQRFG